MSTAPAAIQRMIDTTNAGDTAGFLACFTEDAFLSDWGREFSGRARIGEWNRTDNIGVGSQLSIVGAEGKNDSWQIRIAVKGRGFSGEGDMAFTLRGEQIARLIIS